jgi:hypothetical protein
VARARDRLDQHAFEGTLAEFAEQQPDEEVLLVAGCSRQEVSKPPHPFDR